MSITRDQFQLQIDRLADTFGDRFFPEQRTLMIWDYVRGIEYSIVISIVDGFIRGSKTPPLPSDFSQATAEVARSSGRKYALGEIKPREICKCFDCADSGFVHVIRIDGHDEWAKWENGSASCHCPSGRELIAAAKRMKSPTDLGSQFSEHWKKSYRISPEFSA